MKKFLFLLLILIFSGASLALADWEYGPAPTPDPAPGDASMAFVDSDVITNTVIYSANAKVYGYNTATGESSLLWGPPLSSVNHYAPSGFVVSPDQSRLYFHDNGYPSTYIYEYTFDSAVSDIKHNFTSSVQGSIYSLAVNPWTDNLWFASGDIDDGSNLHLYEMRGAGTSAKAILRATLTKKDDTNSGNGPIIFKGPDTVLFGETLYGGDGYFHLLDTAFGETIAGNYLTFADGLAAATYGYNNEIYAVTADGKTVEKLMNGSSQVVQDTDLPVRGIAFGDDVFYLGEILPDWSITGTVLTNTEAFKVISATEGFRCAAISAPDPAIQAWNYSIACFGNSLVYSDDDDNNIYSLDLATGESSLLVDVNFSNGSPGSFGPSGFVTGSLHLYYHDNGNPTRNIYRRYMGGGATLTPTLALSGTVQGSIYAMTWNPWTDSLWLCSAAGDNMYLYEINEKFNGIEGQGIVIPKEHSARFSGNGPIIFIDENTCLYGETEAMWDGNDKGYFHKVNVKTKAITQDVLTFDGGLAGAVYGMNHEILVNTGGGMALYNIGADGSSKTKIADLTAYTGGMAFDGTSLHLCSGSLAALWKPIDIGTPSGQAATTANLGATADLVVKSPVKDKSGATIYIGIEGDGNTYVESLEAIDPIAFPKTGRPYSMPIGMVKFRVKVAAPGAKARVTVRFSGTFSKDARWWKYSEVDGWYLFPNATLASDGKSFDLEITDGGLGDADGMVNGYVTDPGGPAVQEPSSGVKEASDSSSDCFVSSASAGTAGGSLLLAFGALLLAMAAGMGAGLKRFAARD